MIIFTSITLGIIYLLELVFAFIEKQKPRKIVKPFCMLALIGLVLSLNCFNPLLICAIGMGFIGDIFLIYKDNKICLSLGIVSFFVGHVLYIILITQHLSYSIPLWVIIGLCVFGMLFPFICYKTINQYTKKMTIPSCCYAYILLMEALFSTMLLVDMTSIFTIILFIGVIFFICSDSYLSFTIFVSSMKREDFYIMLTYLFAQTLISIGLAFII